MRKKEQIFKIMAVPYGRTFEVAEEKKEAFFSHKVDPIIIENNKCVLEKIKCIIDDQTPVSNKYDNVEDEVDLVFNDRSYTISTEKLKIKRLIK